MTCQDLFVSLLTFSKGKVTSLGLDLESGGAGQQQNDQNNENFVKEEEEEEEKILKENMLKEKILKEELGSEINDTEVRFISELKVGVLSSCKYGFTHSSLSTDI